MEHLTVISGSGDTFELSLPSQEKIGRIAALFRENISLPRDLFRERVISHLQEYFPVSYRSPLERITVSDAFKLASALMTLAHTEAPSAPAPGTFVSSVFPENFSCKVCVSPSNISLPGAGDLFHFEKPFSFSEKAFSASFLSDTSVSEKHSLQHVSLPFSDTFFTSSLQSFPSEITSCPHFSLSEVQTNASSVPVLSVTELLNGASFSTGQNAVSSESAFSFTAFHPETLSQSTKREQFFIFPGSADRDNIFSKGCFSHADTDFVSEISSSAPRTVTVAQKDFSQPSSENALSVSCTENPFLPFAVEKDPVFSFSLSSATCLEQGKYIFSTLHPAESVIARSSGAVSPAESLVFSAAPGEKPAQERFTEESFSVKNTLSGGKGSFSPDCPAESAPTFSQEVILAAYHFKWSLEYAASLPPELLLRCLETALAAANGVTYFPRSVPAAPQWTTEEIQQAVRRGAEALERFKKG